MKYKIEQLKRSCDELTDKVNARDVKIMELKEMLSGAKLSPNVKILIEGLKDELKEKDARIAELEKELVECRETLANVAGNNVLLQYDIEDLKAQLKKFEWRPIETAPKDGTHVMLFDNDAIKVGLWWEPYNDWGPRIALIKNPTHWIPLPTPPKEEE